MAVAYGDDASGFIGGGGAPVTTGSLTLSSSNGALYVGVVAGGFPAPGDYTSATWDVGTPENLSEVEDSGAFNNYYRRWQLLTAGLTAATDTVSLDWGTDPTDVGIVAIAVTGADQTTPSGGTANANQTGGTSISCSPGSPGNDDLVVDVGFIEDNDSNSSASPGANQTAVSNQLSGSGYDYRLLGSYQDGADGNTMSWSYSGAGGGGGGSRVHMGATVIAADSGIEITQSAVTEVAVATYQATVQADVDIAITQSSVTEVAAETYQATVQADVDIAITQSAVTEVAVVTHQATVEITNDIAITQGAVTEVAVETHQATVQADVDMHLTQSAVTEIAVETYQALVGVAHDITQSAVTEVAVETHQATIQADVDINLTQSAVTEVAVETHQALVGVSIDLTQSSVTEIAAETYQATVDVAGTIEIIQSATTEVAVETYAATITYTRVGRNYSSSARKDRRPARHSV